MRVVETNLKVRYAETDQMGIVHHANYFVWCEVGRVTYCKVNNLDYRRLEEEDGILLVVAEVQCRYVEAARFDDEVVVATRLEQANPRILQFSYEIKRRHDGALLARAFTKHVFCNRNLRPTRLPEKHFAALGIPPVVRHTGAAGS